jgi:hypothetical protein
MDVADAGRPPDTELIDRMRHRLNYLINGELRASFG